jgi:hypothetical protein
MSTPSRPAQQASDEGIVNPLRRSSVESAQSKTSTEEEQRDPFERKNSKFHSSVLFHTSFDCVFR